MGGFCTSSLGFFFLCDVGLGLGHVPSGCFAESVPEVMERGKISGLHCDHPVVCGAPDVSVFGDYCYVFGEFLLEALPISGRLLLVGFS